MRDSQNKTRRSAERADRRPVIRPRLQPVRDELPPQAGRLITMLCDDPTDIDLIEVEWYLDAAGNRH